MNIKPTELPGVIIIEPRVFEDERGFFMESYHEQRYFDLGISERFVQDNHSRSRRNVLRGLHSQMAHPQGKLVRAVTGCIWDVAVDVDPDSDTYRQWFGTELSDTNSLQLYIPPGYVHGFVVLSESADVLYKCTDFYVPGDELGILWNDRELGIEWPITDPIISSNDKNNLTLSDYVAQVRK